MFMKSHIVLTALFLSIFLSACTNSAIGPWDTILPDVINTENTIEKPWTNSMEEIIKDWNISNMKNEKKWKIKFHKFIIPSMALLSMIQILIILKLKWKTSNLIQVMMWKYNIMK